ncbi:MAG: hypothetical protein HY271_10130 [Deltaproteobacteria bacterium]|nr:hypothetical protein [Deltaproteobacteria bacterium]
MPLVVLVVIGVTSGGLRRAPTMWKDLRRPVAVWRMPFTNGIAISLNRLERERRIGALLPGLQVRGVLLDRARRDWVLFGERDDDRRPLPVDAITVALRALRLEIELPGIDIRPAAAAEGDQVVTYFGGAAQSIVGAWFFRFDYWMKLASLGREEVPISDFPVYIRRAREALDRDVASCTATGPFEQRRRNRYWLCGGGLSGIDDDDTFTFEGTTLRVLAESGPDRTSDVGRPASPCISRGANDPFAQEFADALTRHLWELSSTLPIHEIETFTRVLAGLRWLLEHDPYRDLRPWLSATIEPFETPLSARGLSESETRAHMVGHVRHVHSLRLSGGVAIDPDVEPARSGDRTLRRLRQTILAMRPPGMPTTWSFTFDPNRT